MEAAAEGAPLAETLHYWREGAHCISAWYSIIAPEKAGGNEAAANPRSSQRRGAANRPAQRCVGGLHSGRLALSQRHASRTVAAKALR